jgi:methionine-R-sulfoxide reductase
MRQLTKAKDKIMKSIITLCISLLFVLNSCGQSNKSQKRLNNEKELVIQLDTNNWNPLTKEEAYVIEQKGTEYPNTGKYVHNNAEGVYVCKRCDTPLFSSSAKFDSGTGWPSFDSVIDDNVEEVLDADGMRAEIVCKVCKGHLGHVFKGEGFTKKNTRHCVNSISLNFIPEKDQK